MDLTRYDAEFELPDALDPFGGTARVSTMNGVYHSDPDEANFPGLSIEAIDIHESRDLTLWAATPEHVVALREHLNAALDDLMTAVQEYVAADPKRRPAAG